MEDKLTTMIVNEAEHDLIMKVGNRELFVPLAVMGKGCEYNVELIGMNWAYQEYLLYLEEKHGDGTGKKLSVTFDDCCDYERIPLKEADGEFVAERVRRKQFNAEEHIVPHALLLLMCRAAYGAAFDGIVRTNILRGDSKLASAALKLARHVRARGIRGGSDELLGLVLELFDFAQSACESPLLCPARMQTDPIDFQDPRKYADSLVLLARDVNAHPWGAFRFVYPAKYLPFLQQLAEDLI